MTVTWHAPPVLSNKPEPRTAGKDPKAADISAVIASAGAEADAAQVELLLKELEGKVRLFFFSRGSKLLTLSPPLCIRVCPSPFSSNKVPKLISNPLRKVSKVSILFVF